MIINANALRIPLADQSVHCIVTSPPYWGLRDYGTATWQGGDAECKHILNHPDRKLENQIGGLASWTSRDQKIFHSTCGKCGAIRVDNQLGLERTPDEYIANMVAVFHECWRVLRDDGTCWVNMGDSYITSAVGSQPGLQRKSYEQAGNGHFDKSKIPGYKNKNLCGIPWRLAFALQADGWYLRSDIIWSKPNPMPESVTDRPTKSHEYLFLLAKQARYYYDAEAIREPQIDFERGENGERVGWDDTERVEPGNRRGTATNIDRNGNKRSYNPAGRNRRTVWTIPTAPYKGAHFATFPPALVEPCIKAGTSERGCCPKCGKGWKRVVETERVKHSHTPGKGGRQTYTPGSWEKSCFTTGLVPVNTTLGWQPACNCNAGEPIPCLVFDPFVGSGTTVKVAYDLGRRGVGLDLSLEYLDEQARKRIHNGHTARLF